ncbi:MAG: hypothetical protein JXR86_16885 [Spirochaetales bacterium]|nr:hypothetical protein [Spirochaetales bacterium]
MKPYNPMILSTAICSCRAIDVPPVGNAELQQIIRHKLAAFYPGSPDDLYIDFIKAENRAVVFFSPRNRIDTIRSEYGNIPLYSTWHVLAGREHKNGLYAVPGNGKYDLYVYENDTLVENRVSGVLPPEREVEVISVERKDLKHFAPLFRRKKKKNYLLPNLILAGLILMLPQGAYYRQILMDEKYTAHLKSEIVRLTAETIGTSSSQEEFNSLKSRYEEISLNKPLNIMVFLSELSSALGRDVVIDNLVLKNGSFQMNGTGLNPLGKMENFQNSAYFMNVVPYQVKAIEGTSRESFSLTGVFRSE